VEPNEMFIETVTSSGPPDEVTVRISEQENDSDAVCLLCQLSHGTTGHNHRKSL
jgi:hypothetical protein